MADITADDVLAQLQNSITLSNSTWDVTSGPVIDVMARPQSGQIAAAENAASDLRQLFTLQFPAVITSDEATAALGNYGSAPGLGRKAQVTQYFMSFSKPTVDVPIPAGSLVSNVDGSLVYTVIASNTIYAASSTSYYNPSRNTYEIPITIQAIGVGSQYEIPAQRINTLLTPIIGIDATENRSVPTLGTSAETLVSQSTRLSNALLGINKGATGGLATLITNAFSDLISDVSVVQPFDKEFTRMISGPALDMYLMGSAYVSVTQSFQVLAGDVQFLLTNVPVFSINSVLFNNTAVTNYQLVPDSSRATGYSLDSQDYVVFSTPFAVAGVLTVGYTYNSILSMVYSQLFSSGSSYLFNTDMLLRLPFNVSVNIQGVAKVLPSYSATDVTTQINAYLQKLLTPTSFSNNILYPEITRQNLLNSVPGIQTLRFNTFKRNVGSLSPVEVIILNKNEEFYYDATIINIQVN